MSDRYDQPAPGTLMDTWGTVLNQNFSDIGDDIETLLSGEANSYPPIIAAGDSRTLHTGAAMVVAAPFTVDGEVVVEGNMKVI